MCDNGNQNLTTGRFYLAEEVYQSPGVLGLVSDVWPSVVFWAFGLCDNNMGISLEEFFISNKECTGATSKSSVIGETMSRC
jgi:hypothetical protein